MTNMEMNVDKAGKLHITIDLNREAGFSKTGKSMIVATTNGNQVVPFHGNGQNGGQNGGKVTYLGVNCYRK